MKTFLKIFIVILCCFYFSKSKAQQLSKEDIQIVKDIQQAVSELNMKTDGGFKDLLIYGVVAKDTDVFLYNAVPTELLHASKYSMLDYFIQKKNVYVCTYSNVHEVMLVHKALEDLSYKLGSDWELYQLKSNQNDYSTNSLYFKGKEFAHYKKPNDNSTLVISFTASYNDEMESNVEQTNSETFTENLSKELDKIDLEMLSPDSAKVAKLQNEFYTLITKAKRGFKNIILGETKRDKVYTHYKVVPQNKMQAQFYELVDSVSGNGGYFICGYTNPNDVIIAKYAIAGLKNKKDIVWTFEAAKTFSENLVRQNIFANSKFVGYTYYVKANHTYYIAIKNFMRYTKGLPVQKFKK